MLNEKVISSEFAENMNFSTSFDEFVHKENRETYPLKYEVSMCEKYVIGYCNTLGKKRYS